jgi:hypothetical protein
MFCCDLSGSLHSKETVTDDCCDGEENPLKDKWGTSKPNNFDRMEIGSV